MHAHPRRRTGRPAGSCQVRRTQPPAPRPGRTWIVRAPDSARECDRPRPARHATGRATPPARGQPLARPQVPKRSASHLCPPACPNRACSHTTTPGPSRTRVVTGCRPPSSPPAPLRERGPRVDGHVGPLVRRPSGHGHAPSVARSSRPVRRAHADRWPTRSCRPPAHGATAWAARPDDADARAQHVAPARSPTSRSPSQCCRLPTLLIEQSRRDRRRCRRARRCRRRCRRRRTRRRGPTSDSCEHRAGLRLTTGSKRPSAEVAEQLLPLVVAGTGPPARPSCAI